MTPAFTTFRNRLAGLELLLAQTRRELEERERIERRDK